MATDWWPTQEGRIYEDFTINAISGGTITECTSVKFGTSASGQITVTASTAIGDSAGISLRAASTGDAVLLLRRGAVKLSVGAAVLQGSIVMNSGATYMIYGGLDTNSSKWVVFGGVSHILGTALQTATAASDEIVIDVNVI